MSAYLKDTLGVVIIGRNEGQRLVDCLESVKEMSASIVYVDSGSTDYSVANARLRKVEVISLDMQQPFTAARARNTGLDYLRQHAPQVQYIQFVDGDCEIAKDWLEKASVFLNAHPDVAAVCGRRRERYPENSIYNTLCDLEWDTPIGEAKACGGDVLMRKQALDQVVGYRDDLIAGEEPELCIRLRQRGWKIMRLDAEMTMHDAAIHHFSQWWKRMIRTGFAFAAGVDLHGDLPEKHWVKESRRAWLWGLIIPVLIFLMAIINIKCLWLLLVYPAQMLKISFNNRYLGKSALAFGFFTVVGKFAEIQGQFKFLSTLMTHQKIKIIEYKSSDSPK